MDYEIRLRKGRYELWYMCAICDSGRILIHGRDFQEFRDDCFTTLTFQTPELSKAFRSYLMNNNK